MIADILLEIEAELRRIKLWSAIRPDNIALSSPNPFCYDTLTFDQWLQWILIPRTKTVIEADLPLPGSSDIASMAEHVLAKLTDEPEPLLALIQRLDRLFTDRESR